MWSCTNLQTSVYRRYYAWNYERRYKWDVHKCKNNFGIETELKCWSIVQRKVHQSTCVKLSALQTEIQPNMQDKNMNNNKDEFWSISLKYKMFNGVVFVYLTWVVCHNLRPASAADPECGFLLKKVMSWPTMLHSFSKLITQIMTQDIIWRQKVYINQVQIYTKEDHLNKQLLEKIIQ